MLKAGLLSASCPTGAVQGSLCQRLSISAVLQTGMLFMRDAKQQVEACRASLLAAQEDVDGVAVELAPCIEDLQSQVHVEEVVEKADQVMSLLDSLGCGRHV